MTDIEKAVRGALRRMPWFSKTHIEDARHIIDQLKSQGLVIVPREPTEGMNKAGNLSIFESERGEYRSAAKAYRKMITAYEEEQ